MSVGVVGAGPAGLITAILLAQRGESVTLIDEHSEAGGHLTYDHYQTRIGQSDSAAWLAELTAALDHSTVTFLNSTIAWAAFRTDAGIELTMNCAGREQTVVLENVVVAAGTTDLPLVAPGATLPGVMTSRAIRILLNRHHVIPGRRVVIVGADGEAERLRDDLISAGCEIVALVAPQELSTIAGDGGVQSVTTRDGATQATDIVVVGRGEVPDLHLAGMLEAPRTYDAALGGWRLATADGVPGVHAVGGSLLGPGSPQAIVQSAVAVADRICGKGSELRDCGLSVTDQIMQAKAVA
jgi:methylglutamate dehydrogenase subunit C